MTRSLALATALALIAGAQIPAQTKDAVTLKVVKYDDLGKEVAKHLGKVVLVDFWADWCPPCKAAFPHVVELHNKHQKDGLVVISVTVDAVDDQEQSLKFLQSQKATFTNLLLDEKTKDWQDKLRTAGVPCYYVFNRKGRWVQFSAPKPTDKIDYAKMDQTVLEFLKEK